MRGCKDDNDTLLSPWLPDQPCAALEVGLGYLALLLRLKTRKLETEAGKESTSTA